MESGSDNSSEKETAAVTNALEEPEAKKMRIFGGRRRNYQYRRKLWRDGLIQRSID